MQKAQNIEVLCFLSAASEEAIVANVFTISKVLHDVPSSHRSSFSSSTARIQSDRNSGTSRLVAECRCRKTAVSTVKPFGLEWSSGPSPA